MTGVSAARRLIGPSTPATPYAPYLLLEQYFAMRHAVTRVKPTFHPCKRHDGFSINFHDLRKAIKIE